MKKMISCILVGTLLPVTQTFGLELDEANCSYAWEFQECKQANFWGGGGRSVEWFECRETQNEAEMMLWIVLDKKFKPIRKDIEDFKKCLQENKDYYFWPNAKELFIAGEDNISALFFSPAPLNLKWICLPSTPRSFRERYRELCGAGSCVMWGGDSTICNQTQGTILEASAKCFGWSLPFAEAQAFIWTDIKGTEGYCFKMAEYTLKLDYKATEIIMETNKMQVRKDDKKRYFQDRRSKYSELIDMMLYNLWFIERVWKKWSVRLTNNVHQ